MAERWTLDARPDELARAAAQWRQLSRSGERSRVGVADLDAGLAQRWRGGSARAYQARHRAVVAGLAEFVLLAAAVAELLEAAASALLAAQRRLDLIWAASAPAGLAGAALFAGRALAVSAPVGAAADGALAAATGRLTALGDRLSSLADSLRHLADPAPDGTPERRHPGSVLLAGGMAVIDGTSGMAVIDGTSGDDVIRVDRDRATGEQVVTVDGVVRRLPAGTQLVIRAGDGDDAVTVATDGPVTVLGGAGDDRVRGGAGDDELFGLWGNDTLQAGAGDDRVAGGAGDDYVDGQAGDDRLSGGPGADTLYGLDGQDRVGGGDGRDYLDGGPGSDDLAGGAGADVLAGGRGDDILRGGGGDDVLYTGAGADRVDGGAGADRAFVQADDRIVSATAAPVGETGSGSFIRIEGSPQFAARVESDLDTLRSSATGHAMLAALQRQHDDTRGWAAEVPVLGRLAAGDSLVIREVHDTNGYADTAIPRFGPVVADIRYDPTFDGLGTGAAVPPVVVLYHELAHVEDAFAGTIAEGTYAGPDNPGVPNLEREAVGLPFDVDGDPATPMALATDHPFPLTENGLRAELGLPARTRY